MKKGDIKTQIDLGSKVNGLSSSTVFKKFYVSSTLVREVHFHPEHKELIVVDTWWVPDGDDVSQEFEVVASFDSMKDFEESEYSRK